MDNNVYITLSKQLALFRDMEVTANNIANANTTGYSAEHVHFISYLTRDNNLGNRNDMSFGHDISTYRTTDGGPMKATGNQLDLGIEGPGYFAVETPLGIRYTRAGNFQIDGEGTLTNAEGYPVLDNSSQHIIMPDDVEAIEVGDGGNMKVNGEDFATIGVYEFENQQLLEPLTGGLLRTDATGTITETPHVKQGVLEASNVEPVKELTHMIEVSRNVTNTAKFIETVYDLQRKAANTWAQQA